MKTIAALYGASFPFIQCHALLLFTLAFFTDGSIDVIEAMLLIFSTIAVLVFGIARMTTGSWKQAGWAAVFSVIVPGVAVLFICGRADMLRQIWPITIFFAAGFLNLILFFYPGVEDTFNWMFPMFASFLCLTIQAIVASGFYGIQKATSSVWRVTT